MGIRVDVESFLRKEPESIHAEMVKAYDNISDEEFKNELLNMYRNDKNIDASNCFDRGANKLDQCFLDNFLKSPSVENYRRLRRCEEMMNRALKQWRLE